MYAYSEGYLGQGTSYCFMSTYLVVYLSECVGLSSSTASTISALALLVEVVMGMIIGNASDNCTSKMGRRRPFLLAAGIAMLPIFLFLFHTIEASKTVMFIYYLFFALLFRVFFASFEIPNQAFGAEIAFGYDERTKLRTISRIFSIIGNGIAYLAPLYILKLFGDDNARPAWQVIGLVIGLITTGSWLLSVYINRGKGIVLTEKKEKAKISVINIFKNYMELVRLKPAKLLVIYKAGFTCAYALINVATIYYLKYSVGLDEKYTSYIYWITLAIFVIMLPIVNKMALKMGKSKQQLSVMLASVISGILVFFFCPSKFIGACVYFGLFSVTQTSFWQLSSAVFYDLIEVDEWANNKRREGDIMSLVSVLGTLISALMVQIFGILFDMAGYDPSLAVQPQSAVTFLNVIFILVPSLCLLLAVIALKSNPINKETFESLQEAIKLRKEGKDYSAYEGDVKKIMGE